LKIKISNISALQYFQIIRYGVLILTGIVFTKSEPSLSKGEIGLYETFILLSGVLCFFWVTGLIQSLLTLYNKNKTYNEDDGKKPEILFNSFVLIILFNLLTIGVFLAFNGVIANIFTEKESIPNFDILIVYIFLINPTFLIEYYYLLNNKPRSILIYGTLSFVVQFFLVAAPVSFSYPVYYSLVGLCIAALFRFGWLLVIIITKSRLKFNLGFIKEHLNVAWPLIVSSLLAGSAQYTDSLLVAGYYSDADFAIFRFGARELPLALLLTNSMSNAFLPIFSDESRFKDSLNSLKNKTRKLAHFLFPLTLILLITSNLFFPVVFNEDFTYSAKIFNIYLLLLISRMFFPQTVLIGMQKTKVILFASFMEILVNIVFSIIFIQYFGLIGVAFATVLAFFTEKVILVVSLYKYGIKLTEYSPLKEIIFYSILTIIIYMLTDYMIFTDI